jgi:hypothetical protein
MLKERAGLPSASLILQKLDGSLPNLALRNILLNDTAAAEKAIEQLQQPVDMAAITTDEGIEVGWQAMAFDWLYDHPAFTAEKKKKAAENIAWGAERLIQELEHGAHVFHTRMYGWAMGITLAGLALNGEHPQAERFAIFGRDYFRQNLFPARKLQDGSVHNSFGYGRKYTMWLTAHFLSAWYSATGEDLWQEIGSSQEDWPRKEILFNIYGRYPDKSYLRFGDSYSIFSDNYSFRAVAERTWAYGDSVGQGFLNQLIEENQGNVVERPSAYIYFLFYDPQAQELSPASLPTKIIFSPHGTGMVIWKSDWSQRGTTVFFKCGNYFDDHGHFDQGHLDVFRQGTLLLDSGAYLTFDGPFRMEYWHKSVAHNTILVVDPGIENDEGGQRVFHSQEDGTMAEYMADTLAETGDILDYRVEKGLDYVAGDMTRAYPADRVRRVTREVAFLADRYLVVVDRLVTARPELVPKVLWHCPLVPKMDNRSRSFIVERPESRAIVNTLWPKDARLEWIEGFRVGNKIIPAQGTQKGFPDMGKGRVEVSAKPNQTEYLFVHVIDVADNTEIPGKCQTEVSRNEIQVTAGENKVSFYRQKVGLIR